MPSSERWLLRDVVVDGRRLDCRISAGRVVDLADTLQQQADERELAAGGGELVPGLAEHHAHVLAAAAARRSVDLRGATDLSALQEHGSGWLRAVGASAELTRADLDAVVDRRPVRVQHRSGALWTLNGAAVDLVGAGLSPQERLTGQIWRGDSRLRALLDDVDDGLDDEVRRLSRDLATWGFTHVTDATPDLDAAGLARVRSGLVQHVTSLGATGDGPRKIVLHDHTPLDFDEIRDEVARHHAVGRAVAVHAISATSLAMTIAVLSEVGVLDGDRVEHAAVCDDGAARRLAELGVVVVTQPTVYSRRRAEFLRETQSSEHQWLWRHAGLRDRGVTVVVSSDMPYGDPDPAATIRAAAERPLEGVDAMDVLRNWWLAPDRLTGQPRRVEVGAPADLCLLPSPLPHVLRDVRAGGEWSPRATLVGGRLVENI